MSNLKVNSINDASGGSNAVLYGVAAPTNSMGFRNRIINGDMRIDQRNAGASIATTSGAQVYTIDRWGYQASQAAKFTIQQNAGSITPPAGFSNYLGFTVGASANVTVGAADYFMFNQYIEGFNTADLNWGSANAASVTLSFRVYSSVTGTYGGAITNAANNRTYPFTYSIPVANTWTTISITIAGDTTGTWLTTNGNGIRIFWGLGVGSNFTASAGSWGGTSGIYGASGAANWIQTNSAVFYITGVQLEAGSVASPFERRDYGRELMMCQRYAVMLGDSGNAYSNYGYGAAYSTTAVSATVSLPVQMRAVPTTSFPGSGVFMFYRGNTNTSSTSMAAGNPEATTLVGAYYFNSTGLTVDTFGKVQSGNNTTTRILFSAEL